MKHDDCSGGLRSFGTIILALNILIGGLMIFGGCSEMDSYMHSDEGIVLVAMGISLIIAGGTVFNLFNGFALLGPGGNRPVPTLRCSPGSENAAGAFML